MAENELLQMTAEITSAFLETNKLPAADIPALIQSIYGALNSLGSPETAPAKTAEKPTSAQVRRSIKPDGLISFVDGKSYKTLKRHLASNGLTPNEYRARYGLPADYPIVAPQLLGREIGVGQVHGSGLRRTAADEEAGAIQEVAF